MRSDALLRPKREGESFFDQTAYYHRGTLFENDQENSNCKSRALIASSNPQFTANPFNKKPNNPQSANNTGPLQRAMRPGQERSPLM